MTGERPHGAPRVDHRGTTERHDYPCDVGIVHYKRCAAGDRTSEDRLVEWGIPDLIP